MEDPAHGMKETKFGKKRKRKRARYVERAHGRGGWLYNNAKVSRTRATRGRKHARCGDMFAKRVIAAVCACVAHSAIEELAQRCPCNNLAVHRLRLQQLLVYGERTPCTFLFCVAVDRLISITVTRADRSLNFVGHRLLPPDRSSTRSSGIERLPSDRGGGLTATRLFLLTRQPEYAKWNNRMSGRSRFERGNTETYRYS